MLNSIKKIKMNHEFNKQPEQTQKINPGLAKAAWDEVLTRSGIDPTSITEYNVPNSAEEDENSSRKCSKSTMR